MATIVWINCDNLKNGVTAPWKLRQAPPTTKPVGMTRDEYDNYMPTCGGFSGQLLTLFFIGGSVLCATNTVVRSFFGQAILCLFCSPETQHFQKNKFFISFTKKSRNPRCKNRRFIGIINET